MGSRPGVRDVVAESLAAPWIVRQALRAFVMGGIDVAILRIQGVELGRGAVLYGRPIVQKYRGSKVKIGKRFEGRNYAAANAIGCSHPLILSTRSARAEILIGDDVGVTGGVVSASERVHIGNGCLIGADTIIADSDFHPIAGAERRYRRDGIRSAPVSIGANVFIGARAVILKGVSIGDNSVIGAGSIVVRSIPANVIAAGNPAHVVGEIPSAHDT